MIHTLKQFESFLLGVCKCGCKTDINIRVGHYLKRYKNGHNAYGDRNPNKGKNLKGKNSFTWKGGRYNKNGYNFIWNCNHPFKGVRNYIREHRLIYEEYLTKLNGIPTFIHPKIEIHHINGIKDDNRIENMILVTHNEHSRIHGIKRGGLNGSHA